MDKLSMIVGGIAITGSILVILILCLVAVYNFKNRNQKNNSWKTLSPQSQKVVDEAVSILQADGDGPNYQAVARLFVAEACPNAVDLVAYMREHVRENITNSNNYGQPQATGRHETDQDHSQVTGQTAQKIARAEAAINARRDANGRYIPASDTQTKVVVKWRENTWIEK